MKKNESLKPTSENSQLDELIGVVLSRPQLADGRGIQMIFNPNEIAKCKQHLLNM